MKSEIKIEAETRCKSKLSKKFYILWPVILISIYSLYYNTTLRYGANLQVLSLFIVKVCHWQHPLTCTLPLCISLWQIWATRGYKTMVCWPDKSLIYVVVAMLYIFIYKVFAWIEAYKGWTWRRGVVVGQGGGGGGGLNVLFTVTIFHCTLWDMHLAV